MKQELTELESEVGDRIEVYEDAVRLDEDDLYALAMLPVRCDRKDRNYFRLEYLKIINRYFY